MFKIGSKSRNDNKIRMRNVFKNRSESPKNPKSNYLTKI